MAKNTLDTRLSMFGRLAMESGLVTHAELVGCIEEQDKVRAEGGNPPRLGELLVEKGILTQDEVGTILRMQANPGGLIGRQLVERGLVTRQQIRECLDEQTEYQRRGVTSPRLGEMLVQKGMIKAEDLNQVLRKQDAPGHLFGEFLVSNRLVKEDDINRCLVMQKDVSGKGRKAPRLGEMLVQCGVLRKEQVELYSQRHLQSRKRFTAPANLAVQRTNSRVVKGDLFILETLGQHFDGVTYKAIHGPSGAVVAAHFFTDEDPEGQAGELFERKCRAAAKIRHEAVQPLFYADVFNNRRVLVAEYLEGNTLDKLIADQGKIEWAWMLEMAHDLAGALAQAHNLGITHDDVRPGSIIVDYAGNARLSLWAYTRDPLTNREWLGKRHRSISFYDAPERLRAAANARTDIFSLGMTLIHAVTGRAVLRGASLAEAFEKSTPADAVQNMAMDVNLPLGFVTVLARMVEADPENRYGDYHELLTALDNLRYEQGLDGDVDAARGTLVESQVMSPEQAAQVVSSFLKTDMATSDHRRVSSARLLKFYAGPIAAMLVLMILVTAVYRTTQASRGLMVRANWRDQQGDKAGALSLYRIISTLYPKNETVQKRYYDLALEEGDHGEAEIALERLIELHPDRETEHLETQADLQVWQNRFLSAADLYRKVLAGRPYDVSLRTKLANALLWAQSYPEAQREFTELVAMDRNNNALILGLARSAAGNKDVETAMRMFGQLDRQGLLSESTFMEYAWMLSDSGRRDELKDVAAAALRRRETEDFRMPNRTQIYLWAGDYAKAAEVLNTVANTDLEKNNREFLETRIGVNDRLGNFDQVIRDYENLAMLDPSDPKPLLIIAGHYQGRQDFAAAETYLRQALARTKDDPEIMNAIADNYLYQNKSEEAEGWFKEILDKHPDNDDAAAGLVDVLVRKGKYDDALAFAERLYKADPKSRLNRVNLAVIYTWIGRNRDAFPLVDSLVAEGALTDDERDVLAVNAMNANANDLLVRLVGSDARDGAKISEYRLILARRMRAQGRHAAALPLYAAVLSSTPNPAPALLMEMSETANWAGRHDIAAGWLELARDLVAEREQGGIYAPTATPALRDRFRLSPETWKSLLEPLRRDPSIYDSVSGFQERYGISLTGERNQRGM